MRWMRMAQRRRTGLAAPAIGGGGLAGGCPGVSDDDGGAGVDSRLDVWHRSFARRLAGRVGRAGRGICWSSSRRTCEEGHSCLPLTIWDLGCSAMPPKSYGEHAPRAFSPGRMGRAGQCHGCQRRARAAAVGRPAQRRFARRRLGAAEGAAAGLGTNATRSVGGRKGDEPQFAFQRK